MKLTEEKKEQIRKWFRAEYRAYLKECEDHADAMYYILHDVFAECGMDVWKMADEDAEEVRRIVQEEGELI